MAETQRLKINGKVYRAISLDEISLADIIVFDEQAADARFGMTFDDLEALTSRLSVDVPEGQPKPEPSTRESAIISAVTVWLVRRAAGEDVTLAEAARTPATSIQDLPATGDKTPKAKRKPARKASVPATAPAAPADDPSPSETSRSPSAAE